MKYIVDIKGEIEGDYEIIGKYDEVLKGTDIEKQAILLLINSGWLVNHDKELRKKWARPQGKWIRTGSLGNGNARYECSNCHRGDVQAESQEVPYCWHCGAKMQKGGAE